MKQKAAKIGKILLFLALGFALFFFGQEFPAGSVIFWILTVLGLLAGLMAMRSFDNFMRKPGEIAKDYNLDSLTIGPILALALFATIAFVSMIVGLVKLIIMTNTDTFSWINLIWFVPSFLYIAAMQMFKVKKDSK